MAADHKTWNWYQLPSCEYKLMLFAALVTGAHVYAGMSSPHNNVEKLISNFNDVYSFIRNNEKSLYPTKNLAKTAIVWSNVNADYYKGGNIKKTDFTRELSFTDIGDLHKEFDGFYEACFLNHIPVDVIDEVSLIDGSTSNYDIIMLPNIACMSDREIEAIKDFVRRGGILISSFETSMYNEYGEIKADFGLNELFGISLSENHTFGPLYWDYVMPVYGAPYMEEFSDYKYIPSTKYVKKTLPEGSTKILDMAEFLKGQYDGQPGRSKYDFCYLNNYGKGKSIYFAGTIGQGIIEWHIPEYLDIMEKIIKSNSSNLIELNNISKSVSINLRKNVETGEILIYFVNYTGPMTRPIREVIEFNDVQIKLSFKAKYAKSLYLKDNVSIEPNENGCTITIKKLKEFEVIVLEV